MNLGLDIDGTITACPRFFALLSKAGRERGGKVYVITSRTPGPETEKATREELERPRIEYDGLFFPEDFETAGERCPHGDLDWYGKYLWQK